MSCFQGLFFCPEAASLLLHNFCIYHISPPGHEVCNSTDLNVFFIEFRTEYYYLPSFSPLELQQEFLQLGAAAICNDNPIPSAEDLADQIVEVLNYFG
jgi:hypothetical protein